MRFIENSPVACFFGPTCMNRRALVCLAGVHVQVRQHTRPLQRQRVHRRGKVGRWWTQNLCPPVVWLNAAFIFSLLTASNICCSYVLSPRVLFK